MSLELGKMRWQQGKLYLFITAIVILTGCASDSGSRSVQDSQPAQEAQQQQAKETKTGLATFMGESLQGEKTASGEKLDTNELVAAHPTYPMGTVVQVTNLENQRTAELRIVDRSATAQNQKESVILDVSLEAAEKLGFDKKKGKVRVQTEVIEWGKEKKTP